ncbi:hypothetical protein HDR61_02055 [bacterium]|nr:hypothetical protein [bacterium]
MNNSLQTKIISAIASGRVLKSTDQDLMFYHVIDHTGRTIVQLTVPFSGLGGHGVIYNGSQVLYVNWRPEYDFIDLPGAEKARATKAWIRSFVIACDRKIQKQIMMSGNNRRTK